MKRWFALCLCVLAILLGLLGCQREEAPEQTEYVLYFLVSLGGDGSWNGSALETEPYVGAEEPDPEDLVRALLEGPKTEGLRTPFPRGVTFQSWNWDPEKPGNLQLTLSEQYSGLADMSLTLADYAIVLTLSQLEGVESVEIFSDGHTASYRSHQLLSAEEALLTQEAAG